MNSRLRVTFKDIERTEHLIEFIEERFERLRKSGGNIVRCSVVVSAPHRSHRHGNAYEVSIDLRVPGKEYVGRARSNPDIGADLYSAISDAFNSLSKQVRARRHPSTPPARLELTPPTSIREPLQRPAASA